MVLQFDKKKTLVDLFQASTLNSCIPEVPVVLVHLSLLSGLSFQKVPVENNGIYVKKCRISYLRLKVNPAHTVFNTNDYEKTSKENAYRYPRLSSPAFHTTFTFLSLLKR